MIHPKRFLALVVLAAAVLLVAGAPVQAQCPFGMKKCAGEDSTWCVPIRTQCGLPDSGSVESLIWRGLPDNDVYHVTMSLTVPNAVTDPVPGALIETIIRTQRSAPFETSIIRNANGKWVFLAAAVGGVMPAPGTVRLLAGGQTVGTLKLATNVNVAEAEGFPSALAISTSAQGTSIRWTYSSMVTAQLHKAGPVKVDAVEIQFTSGKEPLRAFEIHGMGIGRITANTLEVSSPASK